MAAPPDHQGRGVGDALLGSAAGAGRPPGTYQGVRAPVRRRDRRRLYGRHGFAEHPRLTGMFRVLG
ncbi:MAG: hypothetical protein ACXV2G_09300 [Actinomycetes bacterium]